MRMTTIVSMILVLLIFAVVFRKLSDLLPIGVCLMAGLAITFGLTEFAIGYLSLLTAFFGAIMIGLGIDFAIHLISRYSENIRLGRNMREAMIGAFVGAGPGILTGAVTTSSAFLVLMIARFKGLAQLGFVSGAGILIMLLLMFTLLPALICLRDRRKLMVGGGKSLGETLPLGKFADLAVHHPRINLLIVALLVAAATYGAFHTSFNWNFRSLEPRGAESMKAIREVEKRLDRGIDYAMYLTSSVEESRAMEAAVKKQPTVKEVESIADYIPENQETKAQKMTALAPVFDAMEIKNAPGADDAMTASAVSDYADAVRGSARVVRAVLQLAILGGHFELEDQARRISAQIDAFADRVEQKAANVTAGATRYQGFVAGELQRLLHNLRLATRGETLTVDQLPQIVQDTFRGYDGRMAVYIYPTDNIWDKAFMERHNADILAVSDKAVSIGILFEEIVNSIIEDFKSSVWFSLLAVFVIVLIDFRRLRTTLLALVPLLVGSIWMVGLMPLIGMEFNMVNVAIVPLILGIGIDNGVHILHRYRMEKQQRVRMAVEHTGRAIMLSALTTMAGFGMLGLATYVAIGTLGQLLLIGVGFCFFTSVYVLPVILGRFEKRNWKV